VRRAAGSAGGYVGPVTASARRALVCGGGGVTGVAWMVGVLAGLVDDGVALDDADLFVGTSAGSVVTAQLAAGVPVDDLYAAQRADWGPGMSARLSLGTMVRWGMAGVLSRDPVRARQRIGRFALNARTMTEDRRRAFMERRITVRDWPERDLKITACDAETGEFVAFDRASGVELVAAVGASCAVPGVWPPVTIGDRRYMDGGVRSPANADLAAGYDRVVVLAPINRAIRVENRPDAQVAALRRAGAAATLIVPDAAAVRAIGRNLLDPARREPSARAGREQAAAVRAQIAAVWSA
jgi:NTE family protein